jgi:hypothetical protein
MLEEGEGQEELDWQMKNLPHVNTINEIKKRGKIIFCLQQPSAKRFISWMELFWVKEVIHTN